ncbi:BQ5605_C016g08089 [Microbotryum silenes-dioicae]|uniref:BQ5605_C016g08089 protein n=1 Tax=Microbotryum silenes-dioicae TaxID=796604 RepID=A0A2X0MQ27_9BASI|nr:BQ5605_C016g08089 [Microbotryum silenes-dioicae]
MPPKASTSTLAPIKSTSEPEPEPEPDLISFQLDLDESLAFAQALVRSWVPSKVDTEWAITTNEEKGTSFNSLGHQLTTNRSNRSGRLGLGASANLLNQQQAQDQKLRNQLLRHVGTHSQPQDDVDEKGTMGNRSAVVTNDEDGEEEEDSRSAAIRSRDLRSSKVSDRSTRTTDKKIVQTTTVSSPSTSTTIKPFLTSGASVETSPIPSTSFYDNHTTSLNVASTSTLTTSTTAKSAPPDGNGAKLTKNQRKKERDREKARLLKLQAMRDSQRAEEEKGIEKKRRIGDVEDAMEEGIAEGKKKTKVEKASPVKNGKGPEGDEESSSEGEEDDDDDDEGPSGNGEGSTNGGTKNKKKKKQRRKKKKGGPSPSFKKGEGVLNLEK